MSDFLVFFGVSFVNLGGFWRLLATKWASGSTLGGKSDKWWPPFRRTLHFGVILESLWGGFWGPKPLKSVPFFGCFFGIDFMLIYVDLGLILELIWETFGLQNASRGEIGDFAKHLGFSI